MLGLNVTPADVQDRDGFLPLLKSVRRVFVFLERLFADGAYSGTETAAAGKRTGKVALEIVKRSDNAKGFVVVAKRWIVERTFGWLGRCRRLAKGLREPHPHADGVCATRHDPAHDPQDRKALSKLMNYSDRLLESLVQSNCSSQTPWNCGPLNYNTALGLPLGALVSPVLEALHWQVAAGCIR